MNSRWLLLLCACLGLSACSGGAASLEEEAVRKQLETYFSSWSEQKMDVYGACFLPQARITLVVPNEPVSTETLTDFLHGQALTHKTASSPMKEVPLNMKITVGNGVAQAAVQWKLTKAGGDKTGTDFFTLARTPEGWRIIALVWEQN